MNVNCLKDVRLSNPPLSPFSKGGFKVTHSKAGRAK